MNTVVIVPYRNREKHLFNLLECLKHRFKDHTQRTCHVFVAEQNNNEAFNCGLMKNNGFMFAIKYMKKNYDLDVQQVVFNDVDCWIESNEAFNYYTAECSNKSINHLYGRNFCLGGIFSVRSEDFINSNGFPNSYLAWGGEDNVLETRLRNLGVYRNNHKVVYERHQGKSHITEDAEHERDMSHREENERKWKNNEDRTGISDLSNMNIDTIESKHMLLSYNIWYHHIKFS